MILIKPFKLILSTCSQLISLLPYTRAWLVGQFLDNGHQGQFFAVRVWQESKAEKFNGEKLAIFTDFLKNRLIEVQYV
jgi:hypothetical protein